LVTLTLADFHRPVIGSESQAASDFFSSLADSRISSNALLIFRNRRASRAFQRVWSANHAGACAVIVNAPETSLAGARKIKSGA
jgi:hypothetical protein